ALPIYGPVRTGKQKSQKLDGFAESKVLAIHDAQGLWIVAVQASAQGAYDAVQALDGFGLPVRNALRVGFFQTGECTQYWILYWVNKHRQVQIVNHEARGSERGTVGGIEPGGKGLVKGAVGVFRDAAAHDVGVQAKRSHG